MSDIITPSGLRHCLHCVGMHPDQKVTRTEIRFRLTDMAKLMILKHRQMAEKADLYKNKSCILCGRTYDENGKCDETWKLTAHRVKQEFDHAGIYGVDDRDIEKVVAKCRKAFITLMDNKELIPLDKWEMMTFQGQLALTIAAAQDACIGKLRGMS